MRALPPSELAEEPARRRVGIETDALGCAFQCPDPLLERLGRADPGQLGEMGLGLRVHLGRIDEQLRLAAAGTIANASATGLCATSEPRMLSSQAIEFGQRQDDRILALLAQRRLQLGDLLLGGLAGISAWGGGRPEPCGGAGRSRPQMRSTGFLGSGLSLMPLGFSDFASSSIVAAVCSQGSKPTTAPACRCLPSQSLSLASGTCSTSKMRVSTWVGACVT